MKPRTGKKFKYKTVWIFKWQMFEKKKYFLLPNDMLSNNNENFKLPYRQNLYHKNRTRKNVQYLKQTKSMQFEETENIKKMSNKIK